VHLYDFTYDLGYTPSHRKIYRYTSKLKKGSATALPFIIDFLTLEKDSF